MSGDYEPQIIEITCHGDTHRLYVVRNSNGESWDAKGKRLCSDKSWAISQEVHRKRKMTGKFLDHVYEIAHSKVPFFMPRTRKQIIEVGHMVAANKKAFDHDEWWDKNWHRKPNPTNDLPDVPDIYDLQQEARQ